MRKREASAGDMRRIKHKTERLSERELEVLELTSRALSTKSVARLLDISTGTAKWHLANIYSKMGAHSREQAVMQGRHLGLIR